MNTSLLALIAISLLGGSLPLFVRWSHRQLHAVLAMSTGIFLGAVFLHLLPSISVLAEDFGQGHASAQEAPGDHAGHDHDSHAGHDHGDDHAGHDHGPSEGQAEEAAHQDHDHGDHDHAGHDHTSDKVPADADAHASHDHGAEGDGHGHHGHVHAPNTLWFFVLLGVIGVYLIEGLLLRTHDHGDLHRHRSVGYATLLGVTVHALTAGFGLGAMSNDAFQFDLFLVAILGHKGFEAFSLTTVFQLAEFPRKRVIALVVAFSLVTPLGMLLGARITGDLGGDGVAIATALAAGTFLYVCLSELLPEVFHKREDVLTKLVLLAVGVGLMSFFEGLVG